MIYIPINISNSPIYAGKTITVQKGLTNNFPEIVFELHDSPKLIINDSADDTSHIRHSYLDLGENCQLSASITNTDLETVKFTGTLNVLNASRGQILCVPVFKDFTRTGHNTLTVKCSCENYTVSFQTTIFVQSVGSGISDMLN